MKFGILMCIMHKIHGNTKKYLNIEYLDYTFFQILNFIFGSLSLSIFNLDQYIVPGKSIIPLKISKLDPFVITTGINLYVIT